MEPTGASPCARKHTAWSSLELMLGQRKNEHMFCITSTPNSFCSPHHLFLVIRVSFRL